MPIASPFHERTFPLCASLAYREWAGYYAASVYETQHDHEYHAIREGAALIDVTPLFKYLVSGRDAARLMDRLITRDARAMAVGQVYYTPWCDERGHVIDDGTLTRLAEDRFRWTAADPNLRWAHQNARGLDVTIEDVTARLAALAVQGPTSAAVLRRIFEADLESLKYFRMISGTIAGVKVDVSRTGYTGDLGYEIWIPAERALVVWDAVVEAGRAFGARPTGLLALDVARVEAGLLLIEVDFFSSKKAVLASQLYTPYEMGLGRLVDLKKPAFIGKDALAAEHAAGPARQVVGIEIDWPSVEVLHDRVGLAPYVAPTASRVAVPVYRRGTQVGRATTTTWSPILKKLIALATLDRECTEPGSRVDVEVTVDAVRHQVPATVVRTPFFNPKRKTATPPA